MRVLGQLAHWLSALFCAAFSLRDRNGKPKQKRRDEEARFFASLRVGNAWLFYILLTNVCCALPCLAPPRRGAAGQRSAPLLLFYSGLVKRRSEARSELNSTLAPCLRHRRSALCRRRRGANRTEQIRRFCWAALPRASARAEQEEARHGKPRSEAADVCI